MKSNIVKKIIKKFLMFVFLFCIFSEKITNLSLQKIYDNIKIAKEILMKNSIVDKIKKNKIFLNDNLYKNTENANSDKNNLNANSDKNSVNIVLSNDEFLQQFEKFSNFTKLENDSKMKFEKKINEATKEIKDYFYSEIRSILTINKENYKNIIDLEKQTKNILKNKIIK